MSSILTRLKEKYVSSRGFHTSRQLLVIESDDWGSIRTPSAETLDILRSKGDSPEKDAFLRNDCLENEKDLNALFDVLKSVSDSQGRPCVLTANFAMANPDFDQIDFANGQYAYEPFYDTYNRYYGENQILALIKHATYDGCFLPQLHCREHMNVNRWMNDLKQAKSHTLMAFENKMIGIGASFSEDNVFGYMDAFNTDASDDASLSQILIEAHDIFQNVFGYASKTFVASCFVWNKGLEKTLADIGVEGIQSAMWQSVPLGVDGEYKLKRKLHYTGEKGPLGHIYTVRNCQYEPALYHNPEACVQACLRQIDKAFADGKPAVINSHRLNYIGSINQNNSTGNLEGLQILLRHVVQKYQNVEFISTPELVEIIKGKK